jgi:hypothetical protein
MLGIKVRPRISTVRLDVPARTRSCCFALGSFRKSWAYSTGTFMSSQQMDDAGRFRSVCQLKVWLAPHGLIPGEHVP